MCPCGKAVKSRTHTVGEYEIYEEERDAIEEMTTTDEWDTEKFGTLDSSEKTIVILGDRWWPRTTKQEGDTMSKNQIYVIYGKNVMSAQMLEVSL